MSESDLPLLIAGVTRDTPALLDQIRAQILGTREPFPFASAALALLSGSTKGTRGYRAPTPDERLAAKRLLKATLAAAARRILQSHPDLREELFGHPWFSKKITVGPLGRLDREQAATKVLRVYLADSDNFVGLRERRLLDFDDGTLHAAMVIVYGWGKAARMARGVLQRPEAIHRQAREILRQTTETYGENTLVQLVAAAHTFFWRSVTPREAVDLEEAVTELLSPPDQPPVPRILGHTILADAALRYRLPDLARVSVLALGQLLPDTPAARRHVLALRAWAEALTGERPPTGRPGARAAPEEEVLPEAEQEQVREAARPARPIPSFTQRKTTIIRAPGGLRIVVR